MGGTILKKIINISIILFCSFVFWFLPAPFASAAEASKDAVYYDLELGGKQTFSVLDEDQKEIIITVEEVFPESSTDISLLSVSNGSYKISGSKPGIWEASYYISIINNNMTNAYSPSATAITGSFTSASLKIDNSKQATYYLSWKLGVLKTNHYLRSNIANGSLKITY